MFSVIIPTYNGIAALRQSLPTWMTQTLSQEEYEVIVVDNRSTDDTKAEVARVIAGKDNFHYLYEPQPGATNARHAGARAAKGDILVFADNDGLFNPDCLSEIQKVYDGNKDCVAVTGRIDILWDKKEPDWIAPYKFLLGQLNYGNEISYGYDIYLNGGLMSVRRDVFEQLHGFNPDLIGEHLIGDGDTGFVKKLFEGKFLIGYTPYAVMQHMQHVDKHGSVQGIARHFYNNGIAESYARYRDEGFRINGKVICHLVKESGILIKQWVKSRILHRKNKHAYFTMRFHTGCIHFFTLLLNPGLRREIQVKDVYNA